MTRATLLIDGDIILYRAAVGAEQEVHWGENDPAFEDLWTLYSDLSVARQHVSDTIRSLISRFDGDVVFCVNDKDNFRKHLTPTYKGGRSRKPLGYWALREWVAGEWELRSLPMCEADDTMGILATNGEFEKPVIVSADKDMKTIPARVFRPHTDEKLMVSEAEANYWHLFQTLTGDTTDGYSGCPGVGPKTAHKLLSAMPADPWRIIITHYVKAGLTEDDALLQARLARILRSEDWDAGQQKVKLWKPPSSIPLAVPKSIPT